METGAQTKASRLYTNGVFPPGSASHQQWVWNKIHQKNVTFSIWTTWNDAFREADCGLVQFQWQEETFWKKLNITQKKKEWNKSYQRKPDLIESLLTFSYSSTWERQEDTPGDVTVSDASGCGTVTVMNCFFREETVWMYFPFPSQTKQQPRIRFWFFYNWLADNEEITSACFHPDELQSGPRLCWGIKTALPCFWTGPAAQAQKQQLLSHAKQTVPKY